MGVRNGPPSDMGAVNLGDDADTTGAICGQLAGAFWGESNIPGVVAVWSGTDGHAGKCPGGHRRRMKELVQKVAQVASRWRSPRSYPARPHWPG